MKKTYAKQIKIALFSVIYAFMTLCLSPFVTKKYISSINTYTLICFFSATLLLIMILTMLNNENTQKLLKIYAYEANIILVIYAADNFIRSITGNESYMHILWLCSAFVASWGIFLGMLLQSRKIDRQYFNSFWLSFTPTYAYIFIIAFLREPNTYFELNLIPGKGLLKYYDYFISAFKGDYWMVFNFIGNVVFFIPLIFIVRAFLPKIKNVYAALICFIIPFIVEGYQYIFKCGSVDIDDIIFNFSGIIIGLLIYLTCQKKQSCK